MTTLRALWKLLRGLWHVLVGMWMIYVRFPQLSIEQREARVQAWALQLLALWGIHLRVLGQPVLTGPALIVANHISWLDISVIHAARHCRFVSKSDIRAWPLVGTLATGAGTLYIERTSRKDALRMVKDMADAMKDGDVIAVFPEGTTSDGRELLPFHANLIQAAILAEAPVQPMSLQFVDARTGEPSFAPCYIGDDTLIGSMWRTLTAPPIVAVVHFGDPQHANGRDRRAWAHDLRQTIILLRDA
ncbi:lysophospholipid acyltransferase family protein [Limnohabitans planktonicus]|uniref:1-acyl-sn-glycerol-3-phosphate acyltransferase n=1 Tax=Limnohabitans planktonicus II-D5 TaxID=1293045 RepID=A0A2T7UCE6_9BURK|nr:lysophospholipid acyltransferase family protein [Limnohabitans planktonicus]PVE42367.1 1-acyl-sn-glycerol-3-phosphate acyltransferase [Limnohabitans planktonicus II-D5]|eukprot:gene8821-8633_t